MKRAIAGTLFGTCAAALIWCGGSSSSSTPTLGCVPGESIACAGPGACAGFQICDSNGAGFAPCICVIDTNGDASGTSEGPDADAAPGDGALADVQPEDSTSGADMGSTPATDASSDARDASADVSPDATDGAVDSEGGTGDSAPPADSGDANNPVGDGGPWSPLQLAGLSLWLNPESIVADPSLAGSVRRWLDESGNGNTANTVSIEPTIDPQAVNGHDAVICGPSGIPLQIQDATSLQWGTGDFSLAIVFRYAPGSASIFFQKDANLGAAVMFSMNVASDYEFLVGGQQVVIAAQAPARFHYAIMRGQALTMVADDLTATGRSAMLDVTNAGASVFLCQSESNDLNVEMAEVIAARGTLSSDDLTSLQTYLKTKFGL